MIGSPLNRPRGRKYPYLSVDQLSNPNNEASKQVRATFAVPDISKGMLPTTTGPNKQLKSPKNQQRNKTSKDGGVWPAGKEGAGATVGHQSSPQPLIKPNLIKMMHSLDEMIHQESVTVALPSRGLPLTHKKKMMKSRYQQARMKIELARSFEQSPRKKQEWMDTNKMHQRRSLFVQLVNKSDKLKQIYAYQKQMPKIEHEPPPKVEPWIRYITQPIKLIREKSPRKTKASNGIFDLTLNKADLSTQKSNSLEIRRYLNEQIIEQRMKATYNNHRMHLERRQTMAHKGGGPFITEESLEEERVRSKQGVTPWQTDEYVDGYM